MDNVPAVILSIVKIGHVKHNEASAAFHTPQGVQGVDAMDEIEHPHRRRHDRTACDGARRLVHQTEPTGMSELGEYLGMSPRNMTVLIDGLEKENLVRRVPHERDRRITCVEITDTGRKIAKTELGPSELASAALFDDLSTREQAELLRLLIKVADSLRARGIDIPQYRG